MRFGFFDQLPCAEGFTERQRYSDILAQIELGDRVGFDTVWLGELHFSRSFSTLADPLMVLAAAAQRTRSIRLGTAVTLLPMHNPVKIAEEAAICDILSDGRLEFGVGRGTAPVHYAGYDIPMEQSRERFDEALDYILAAWGSEKFSFKGKYFRAENDPLVPRPIQTPHPQVRIAANSPDTFPFAAKRGFPIFATPLINPPDKLLEGLKVYRATAAPGRHRARLPGTCRRAAANRRARRSRPGSCAFCARPANGCGRWAAATSRASRRSRRFSPGSTKSLSTTWTGIWAFSARRITASSGSPSSSATTAWTSSSAISTRAG